MRAFIKAFLLILFAGNLAARESAAPPLAAGSTSAAGTDLVVREVHYDGKLSENEARFVVDLDFESLSHGEVAFPLFEGDVAVLTTKLPANLRLVREGGLYQLVVARPGRYQLKLELMARITRTEPWNQISFTGPAAAIASVVAQAGSPGMEVQLLTGTPMDPPGRTNFPTAAGKPPKPKEACVHGFLGPERRVALRWQTKSVEEARRALLICDTTAALQINPTVIKYTTQLRYEIVQGNLPKLAVTLPAAQAITRIQGVQIRDWQVTTGSARQILTVEFIKPVEQAYALTIFSEQTLDTASAQISPPQPQEVERESGLLTLAAEDVVVEAETAAGLRQVNAPSGALAAYQFFGRASFALALKLRRIEPVINVADRISARLEETRLLVAHALTLNIEKAGIYLLEATPQPDFVAADVRGDGIEDWKVKDGRLLVHFNSRVLGSRNLEVQLEQVQKAFPAQIIVAPLHVAGGARETAEMAAAAAAGIQLKTAELTGIREIPASSAALRAGETLAYVAEQPDWTLKLAVERPAPHITADCFNLVTIGDGLLGGSATIRYGIVNQGVQAFRVRVPAEWRNLEFTGPNIRRKEQQGNVWTLSLQDKAWSGYTLVITYDQQFDPHKATLAIGGAHPLDVERETGSIAITSAANLQMTVNTASDALRRVDEAELSTTDRALITRPVLQSFQYDGDQYELALDVTRFAEVPLLEAVADRTQLTTVVTEQGEMLTQASFMVKNNDKQFQRFRLPKGAQFWGCYAGNQPVKAERDGDALLVPLPREANRDAAFAVDIVYAQKIGELRSLLPQAIALEAPRTDVPNTYNEWEIYVPASRRLSGFAGNMIVAQGALYGMRDAWSEFARFYERRLQDTGSVVFGLGVLLVVAVFSAAALRRSWRGALAVVTVVGVLTLVVGLVVPNFVRARSAAHRDDVRFAAVEDDGSLATVTAAGVTGPAPANAAPAPVAAGIRPIRIDIPHTGQRFFFTKVLNVQGEPLRIEARAMDAKKFQMLCLVARIAAFVAGLLLLWTQFHRAQRSSFLLALAASLLLGSIGSGLLAERRLHLALIGVAPILALAALTLLVWKFWPQALGRTRGVEDGLEGGEGAAGTIRVPPVVTAIALMLFIPGGTQAAQKPAPPARSEVNLAVAARTAAPAAPVPGDVSILSANYAVTIGRQSAQVDAVIHMSAARAQQIVPLFDDEAAVVQFTCTQKDAKLLRDGKRVKVLIPRRGAATLQLRFLLNHSGDVARRQIGFRIPPALLSKFEATLDEPDASVELPTAIGLKTTSANRQTRVEAILGAGERVEFAWTPRLKRAAEIAATVFCQNATLFTFANGVVSARAALDYQVMQGELRQLKVRLPAGQKLMRVEGDAIRTWKISQETVEPALLVELLKGVSPNYRLVLELEQALATPPSSVKLETPHALEVKRETGLVGLNTGADLSLSLETLRELQKVDVAEFLKAAGCKPEGISAAYRFFKPDFELVARVEAVQPQIEAVVRNSLRVGTEQLWLTGHVEYSIKKAGVFVLRVALPPPPGAGLPADFRVERVAGEKISQWVEKTEGGSRVLEVTLKERTMAVYKLQIELVKLFKELPKSLDTAGVHPLDTQKLTGFIAVTAEEGVQIKTESFAGLTEIPAAQVARDMPAQGGGGVLAYKFISAEPAAPPGWKLAVATELMDSWVRAEIVNWMTLRDTLVSGRSLVRYEIQNAPTKEFRLRVPAAFKNVEITGADIRRRDQTGDQWRVELQNKKRGVYLLTVTWEQSWNVKDRTLPVAAIEVQGVDAKVERETGSLFLVARAPLQVGESSASADLIRIDPREAPDWARRAAETPALAYRYLRPGYQLTLSGQRFAEAEVLQALVESARLTTVVSEDGQMITEMALKVRNHGRQFLEVSLPDKADKIWSAFVAGQAVRPTVREGRFLLPLERSTDDAPMVVELTYVSVAKFRRTSGSVDLASPRLDVPLKNVRWELYLPPGYSYGRFAGTMSRTTAAGPVYRTFTLTEYSKVENEKKEQRQADVNFSVSNARNYLSEGNVKGASENFLRAKLNTDKEAFGVNAELQQLEKDVRKAQARNLIAAQNTYSLGVTAPAVGGQPQVQSPQLAVAYDEAAAEQQWGALQRAQEVAVAQVQPLRVNLPRRGVSYAFEQVLQTQTGKEMTVRFAVASAKAAAWPVQAGWGGVVFLMLWGGLAVGLRKFHTLQPAQTLP